LLAGPEHGRTIPLADFGLTGFGRNGSGGVLFFVQ
jgi:hypothetical protein